ncbi:MAG: dihydrofolate reductase family protein [Actinomycetota bacterium]|nr:dihydrofolate reductase family protein [Actinomycetota bacterium]
MAKLIYSTIASLDGYVADEDGRFDWAEPDDEMHAFVNDLQRPVGTYLYGRRMYDVMLYWKTAPTAGDEPAVMLDYARVWQGADKVVYSTTLERVSSARTRLERAFDPQAVAAMKGAATEDMTIAGPTLAARAFEAGLVDEVHLFVVPVLAGGGLAALPRGTRLRLELRDERRFANGAVYLLYEVRGPLTP